MPFEHHAAATSPIRGRSEADRSLLQRRLSALNRTRLVPSAMSPNWEAALTGEYSLRQLETRFVESERARVQPLARSAPRDADRFVAWFEALAEHGPGQGDPLFPWLAADASREEMRWFLQQEAACQADVGIEGDDEPVWEVLALANLMTALGSNPRYAFQSIGALGALELTAPGRAVYVNAGLKRLGISGAAQRYFALQANLDRRHAAAWNREVLGPLIAADPAVAEPIAEGALLRLEAGARCFERYRKSLWAESRAPRERYAM